MTNIWTTFGRQKVLDIFWTTFLVSIGLRIGHNLRNAQKLHLYSVPSWRDIHGGKDMNDEYAKKDKGKGIFRSTAPEFGPDTGTMGLNFASLSDMVVLLFAGNS